MTGRATKVKVTELRIAWQEVDHEAHCKKRFLESLRSPQLARTSSFNGPVTQPRAAERDVVLRGVLRRFRSRLSCDEKKKVPVTGTNVFKV